MKQLLALCVFCSVLFITAGCSLATKSSHEKAERPDESLSNTYWKLVKLDGAPIVNQDNFREAYMVLHFDAMRLAGATGCNNLLGSYRVEKERITFNRIATTKMVCPTIQMKNERNFLAALKQVRAWSVDGATLVLSDDGNEPQAVFEAVHLY